jgi:hypothetical protein
MTSGSAGTCMTGGEQPQPQQREGPHGSSCQPVFFLDGVAALDHEQLAGQVAGRRGKARNATSSATSCDRAAALSSTTGPQDDPAKQYVCARKQVLAQDTHRHDR